MAIWTRYSSAMSTSNKYIKYRVKLTLNSQSVTNNTSNVTVEIQVWRTNTGYTTYGSGTCYVTIDGTQYTSSITTNHKFTYNSYTVVFSRTLNITHNADGKKTLNISAYIKHDRFSSSSQSYSTSLDTIPRASSVSVSSSSVNFGKSVTINISRHSSSFTHRLRYSVAGQSGTIATGVGTSYSWSVPTSLINGISNNDRATCTIYCDTYSGSTNIGTKSTTVTLIIPVSSAGLSASSVNYGSSVTINISRAHSKLTHRIRYNWNNNTGTVVSSTSSTSYSWTVPNSFMNYIPNSTSTTGTIYVDTYNGTKSIGTKSVSLKTNVPSSVVPSFSSIGHSEQNSAVSALNLGSGVYARNLSKIKFTINGAAGAYSSTIKSYKIVYDGTTYNSSSATTGTIKNSGTRTVTATITDSRGRTASKSTTVSVLAYNSPSISSFSVRRCNADGSNNDMGKYIKVTYGGSMSNLNSKNTATVYIDTKPRSSSTWTTKNSFAITGSFSGTKIFGTYEITQSYDVRIRVIDKFHTVTSTQQLSTAVVTMSWGKQGVGVGKIHEGIAPLEVGGKIATAADAWILRNYSSGTNGYGYFEWYGSDGNRKAYLGIPASSSIHFNIRNQLGGRVNVYADGGLYINDSSVALANHTHVASAIAGTTSGNNFSTGPSLMSYSVASGYTYPTGYGSILNFKANNSRFVQQFFTNQGRPRGWFRTWYDGVGWEEWQEFMTMISAYATGGSNSTSGYVKMSNGIMFCWELAKNLTVSTTTSTHGGITVYRSSGATWAYPAAFSAAPAVLATVNLPGSAFDTITVFSQGTSSCSYEVHTHNSAWGGSINEIAFFAIGKWR
jgi:hypothetical protein